MNVVYLDAAHCADGKQRWATITELFDEAFGDFDSTTSPRNAYPWPLRVLVFPDRGARHFEEALYCGQGLVAAVFDGAPYHGPADAFLAFPENWMTPKEQQTFLARLRDHPVGATLTRLDVMTNSAVMLTTIDHRSIRIVRQDPKPSGT